MTSHLYYLGCSALTGKEAIEATSSLLFPAMPCQKGGKYFPIFLPTSLMTQVLTQAFLCQDSLHSSAADCSSPSFHSTVKKSGYSELKFIPPSAFFLFPLLHLSLHYWKETCQEKHVIPSFVFSFH